MARIKVKIGEEVFQLNEGELIVPMPGDYLRIPSGYPRHSAKYYKVKDRVFYLRFNEVLLVLEHVDIKDLP